MEEPILDHTSEFKIMFDISILEKGNFYCTVYFSNISIKLLWYVNIFWEYIILLEN
jgi:hypothetical protein